MTAPGELSERLVIEEPVEAPDGAGGLTRSYAAAATVWASVSPVSARYALEAAAAGATITHRIVIRAGPAVTTRHRFRHSGRVYLVNAVRIRPGRFLEIDAEERAG